MLAPAVPSPLRSIPVSCVRRSATRSRVRLSVSDSRPDSTTLLLPSSTIHSVRELGKLKLPSVKLKLLGRLGVHSYCINVYRAVYRVGCSRVPGSGPTYHLAAPIRYR